MAVSQEMAQGLLQGPAAAGRREGAEQAPDGPAKPAVPRLLPPGERQGQGQVDGQLPRSLRPDEATPQSPAWAPAAASQGPQAALALHDGAVYYGDEFGLHHRSPDGHLARIGAEVSVTALASERALWVGTTKGLFRLERDALVEIPPPVDVDPRVVALATGPQGEVWASFSGTLLRRGGGSWRRAGPDTGLVTALFTRGPDVWIGTTIGAYRGARRLFEGPVRAVAAAGLRGPVVFLSPDGTLRSETGAVLLAVGYGVRGIATGPSVVWAFDGEGTLRGFSIGPDGAFVATLGG